MVERIISGGQTGADRGGLDAAIALGIPHGGWCPKGRRAEDGRIPPRYHVLETTSRQYPARTRRNVLDADATLIFTRRELTGGSLLTAQTAAQANKPFLVLDIDTLATGGAASVQRCRAWLHAHAVHTLNVAGSRESTAPGIHTAVAHFLAAVLQPQRQPYPTEPEHLALDPPAERAAADPAAAYTPPHRRDKRPRASAPKPQRSR